MEITSTIHIAAARLVRLCLCVCLSFLAMPKQLHAQAPVKTYTIKDGKMIITLSKKITDVSLDSFINQYGLNDLNLPLVIKKNITDSLTKQGWIFETNTNDLLIVSKHLFSFNGFDNPADKIAITVNPQNEKASFAATNNGVLYGYNKFKNKYPFKVEDSTVVFYLKNNTKVNRVRLAGSFTNWQKNALPMIKTDSGWIVKVKLGIGKYWYKFIIDDGNWIMDYDNELAENDGEGNNNSVYYKTNVVFTFNNANNAKRVYLAGSFNAWKEHELRMNKTQNGWELPLYVSEGTFTYRFIADNKWFIDERNPERFPNEFGEYNSVIRIGKPHVFKLNGYTNLNKVVLAASFNDWKENELFMTKTATGWELPYTLGAGNYTYKFVSDGKQLFNNNDPHLSPNKNSYLIIQPNYTFRVKGFANAKKVFLAGDFNGWSPDAFAMKREGDYWVFTVHMFAGKHLYKFVIDDKWVLDPDNKLWEQNEHNTGNSIVWIPDEKG